MRDLGHYGYLILPLALLLVGCTTAAPPVASPAPAAAQKPPATPGVQQPPTAAPRPAATVTSGPAATPVVLPTPQAVGNAARQWDANGHYYKGNPTARVVLEEWTSIQ